MITDEKNKSAKICFPPDPVCARLAMCLMDSDWSIEIPGSRSLNGKTKGWWIGKMMSLYTRNLCAPENGNLGEVMVALYFLVCADELRKTIWSVYTAFSVPLGDWIERLLNENAGDLKRPSLQKGEETQLSFNAIRACRNNLRVYNHSCSWLQDECFLANMYQSGVGFYVYEGCGVIDLVFPLRGHDGDNYRYLPMLLSVKSHVYFNGKDAKTECDRMAEKVESNANRPGALCLLVVFGSHANSTDKDGYVLDMSCVEILSKLEGEVVKKVLRVPTNDDAFGLSEAFQQYSTGGQDVMADMIASHSFVSAYRELEREGGEKFAEKALRLRPQKKNGDRPQDDVTRFMGSLV